MFGTKGIILQERNLVGHLKGMPYHNRDPGLADKPEGVMHRVCMHIDGHQRGKLRKTGDKNTGDKHLHQRASQPETLICKRSSDQLMGERQVEKETLTEAGFTKPSMTFQTKNSSDPSTKGLFSKAKYQAGPSEAEVATD